jgi:hypothetical protein
MEQSVFTSAMVAELSGLASMRARGKPANHFWPLHRNSYHAQRGQQITLYPEKDSLGFIS